MSEQITASDAEKFVRKYWNDVEAHWLPSIPDRFRIEMIYDSAMAWAELTHCGLPKTDAEMTEQRAWLAAYQFTLEHQQKIADVDGEIEFIEAQRDYQIGRMIAAILAGWDAIVFIDVVCAVRCARTLARLEAIRAELRRGVKE